MATESEYNQATMIVRGCRPPSARVEETEDGSCVFLETWAGPILNRSGHPVQSASFWAGQRVLFFDPEGGAE